jgi:anion-transporting  ArsA/GET3 family ATPase
MKHDQIPKPDLNWLNKKLIFILGKGGVGKTILAKSIAQFLATQNKKTLLVRLLSVEEEKQELKSIAPNLYEIFLNSSLCFEEYVHLKLKIKALANFLLSSQIIKYFEKAAPGVKEIVLLGKIWHERHNYDHIVIDMPSTGYALTMFSTPFNFANLFPAGPIYHDSEEMKKTLQAQDECAYVIVTLPQEMPIQESLELDTELKKLAPFNPSYLILNRYQFLNFNFESVLKNLNQNQITKTHPFVLALNHKLNEIELHQKALDFILSHSSWKNFTILPEISNIDENFKIKTLCEKLKDYYLNGKH